MISNLFSTRVVLKGAQQQKICNILYFQIISRGRNISKWHNNKKKFRDALVRLRFGINELCVNKRYESENIVNKDCAFCPDILEDEMHFFSLSIVFFS